MISARPIAPKFGHLTTGLVIPVTHRASKFGAFESKNIMTPKDASTHRPSSALPDWRLVGTALGFAAALAACGGAASEKAEVPPVSDRDAVRLADQASFGPTPALLADIHGRGIEGWVNSQMALGKSRYTSGQGDEVHRHAGAGKFCDTQDSSCLREAESTSPLLGDFYRNALTQPDQLRQRVAFALQQIVVVSGTKLTGTYGFRNYYNDLLANALGNYRDVLKKVALSPLMGDFLNNANNDKAAPNENFARELMQLFSIGNCALNLDGSLAGGSCTLTHTNAEVRSYAYALTGWTYPAGGARRDGCAPAGLNCTYYGGDMVPVAAFHDNAQRKLLSGATVAAGSTAESALDTVLDSLMAHPSMGPFIGKQLILHLVTSNPSPAYVARVATAFNAGRDGAVGSGVKGDLAATVHAVLLDPEARGGAEAAQAGKLREPALLFAGVLRGLNGRTDGEALGTGWGDLMRQHVFRPTSVFNYFKPEYPVPGTALEGPEFSIHGEGAALERLNFLDWLLAGGAAPKPTVANPLGTRVDLSGFMGDASDPARLVDRLSLLALGEALPTAARDKAIAAVAEWPADDRAGNWQLDRVKTAAYLVYASPDYQVQR